MVSILKILRQEPHLHGLGQGVGEAHQWGLIKICQGFTPQQQLRRVLPTRSGLGMAAVGPSNCFICPKESSNIDVLPFSGVRFCSF